MFAQSVSYSAAFGAGILSFFSPCIVPLVPAYFTFITGFSIEELTEAERFAVRRKVIASTAAFVLGFSAVFVLLGASASFFGGLLAQYRGVVRVAGGALIVLLGLHLLGIFRIAGLDFERRVQLREKPLHVMGTFIVGMAFGAGWTPCVGPLLGSILIVASNQDSVAQGIVLLGIYSAGLAVPFLVLSVFINFLLQFVQRIRRATLYLHRIAGVILIVIGLFLITDKLGTLLPIG